MMGSMMRRAMLGDGSTLSLDFTQMSTLADLTSRGLTFSRSTSGTFINANGLVATATAGNPRFDYDPSTLQPRGLLIEGSANNLLTYSDVRTTGWSGINATGTNDSATAPDNTNTATLWTGTSGGANRAYSAGFSVTSGQTYTISAWVKKPSSNAAQYAKISVLSAVEAAIGWPSNGTLDLDTGTISGTGYTVTAYQNGWYRIVSTGTVNTTTTARMFVRITNAAGGEPTVTTSLLWWGAQAETGNGASSLIPTGASTGSRASESLYMDGAAFSAFWPSGQSELSVYFAGDITRPPANTQFLWLSRTGSGGVGASRTRSFITTANSIRANTTVNDLNSTLSAAINTRIRTAVGVRSGSCALATNNGTTSTIVTNADTGLSTDATQLVFNPNADVFQHVSSLKFWPTRLPDAQLQALIT